MLMFDSVVCYHIAFGREGVPPLLRVFAARFALENVSVLKRDLAPWFLKRSEIDKIAKPSRKETFRIRPETSC
jgi:hypothetical protein